jgi:hypothetical protein
MEMVVEHVVETEKQMKPYCNQLTDERFEVLLAMKFQVVIFWAVTRCGDVVVYHLQPEMEAAWFSKTLVSYHINTRYQNLKMEAARSSKTLVPTTSLYGVRT